MTSDSNNSKAELVKCVSSDTLESKGYNRESAIVAVITRTKNRGLFLQRASQSIAKQSFKDFVWIVVNDGGDRSETLDILSSCEVEASKITLVHCVRSNGMEAASNYGITASDSSYIAIHDDDDSWDQEFLQKTVSFMQSSKSSFYSGVVTQTQYVSEELLRGQLVQLSQHSYRPDLANIDLMTMACGNLFPPISFVFSRDVCHELGGFNESLPVLGDWDFNLKFLSLANIAVIQEPLANWHHRDTGQEMPSEYSNSIYTTAALHREFETIVRNSIIRENSQLGPLVAIGQHLASFQQGTFERVESFHNELLTHSLGFEKSIAERISKLEAVLVNTKLTEMTQLNEEESDQNLCRALIQFGHVDAISEVFDAEQYIHKYGDVEVRIKSGEVSNAFQHFIEIGLSEGRRMFVKANL